VHFWRVKDVDVQQAAGWEFSTDLTAGKGKRKSIGENCVLFRRACL